MKKPIILSGKRASGKTTIANAIAIPFEEDRVLRVTASMILNKKKISDKIRKHYDLIIIDDCDYSFIYEIYGKLKKLNYTKDPFTGERIERKKQIVFVFLTQSEIKREEHEYAYYIINCNNKHL